MSVAERNAIRFFAKICNDKACLKDLADLASTLAELEDC
jgi:hypothetical protein